MNKQDLVAAVAKRLGLTKAKANEIAELFFAPTGDHRLRAQARREGRHQRVWELRGPEAGRARVARPAHRQGLSIKASMRAGIPGQHGPCGIR